MFETVNLLWKVKEEGLGIGCARVCGLHSLVLAGSIDAFITLQHHQGQNRWASNQVVGQYGHVILGNRRYGSRDKRNPEHRSGGILDQSFASGPRGLEEDPHR
jgi:hypothetical protein